MLRPEVGKTRVERCKPALEGWYSVCCLPKIYLSDDTPVPEVMVIRILHTASLTKPMSLILTVTVSLQGPFTLIIIMYIYHALITLIIIMYIYHALLNAQSTHMIHINLNDTYYHYWYIMNIIIQLTPFLPKYLFMNIDWSPDPVTVLD